MRDIQGIWDMGLGEFFRGVYIQNYVVKVLFIQFCYVDWCNISRGIVGDSVLDKQV